MIAVVGAGSMGSIFGGLLAKAGHDVTLVDINAEHMAVTARDGLTLREQSGRQHSVRLSATTDATTLSEITLAIVLTKSWATHNAAEALATCLAPDGLAVTVQNGLGNDRVLGAVLGDDRVLGGTTTAGAELLAPGIVSLSPITADGTSQTECAPLHPEYLHDSTKSSQYAAFADLMTAAGLPTTIRPSVSDVIWKKLCLAATAAPLTAVLRCTVADLLTSSEAHRLLRQLFDEIVLIAHAEGATLDPTTTWQHAVDTFTKVGRHQTSMAVDVAKGRRTEIEAMSGELVRLGQRHGISAPGHAMMQRLITAIEQQHST